MLLSCYVMLCFALLQTRTHREYPRKSPRISIHYSMTAAQIGCHHHVYVWRTSTPTVRVNWSQQIQANAKCYALNVSDAITNRVTLVLPDRVQFRSKCTKYSRKLQVLLFLFIFILLSLSLFVPSVSAKPGFLYLTLISWGFFDASPQRGGVTCLMTRLSAGNPAIDSVPYALTLTVINPETWRTRPQQL